MATLSRSSGAPCSLKRLLQTKRRKIKNSKSLSPQQRSSLVRLHFDEIMANLRIS